MMKVKKPSTCTQATVPSMSGNLRNKTVLKKMARPRTAEDMRQVYHAVAVKSRLYRLASVVICCAAAQHTAAKLVCHPKAV